MPFRWMFAQPPVVVPDYFVSNTGDDGAAGTSEATAWQTIAKINAGTFVADDIIGLKGGDTFRETFIPPNAGSIGHNIILTSYGTGKAIISGANVGAPTTPVRDACIYDTDARGYWTIDNIELAYPSFAGIEHDQWTIGGVEVNTPGWTVKNCTFTKCGSQMWGEGIIVEDNVYVGPQPAAAPEGGIYFRGAAASNCIVRRNTVSGFVGRGIWFMNSCVAPTVTDNTVYDIVEVSTDSEGYGINFDGYGFEITGAITCTGNEVYNCDMAGIYMENCTGSSNIKGNLIHDIAGWAVWYQCYAALGERPDLRGSVVNGVVSHNVIYDVEVGLYIIGTKGIDFWNNTVNGTGTAYGVLVSGTNHDYSGELDIQNNIFGDSITWVIRTSHTWESICDAFDYNRVKTNNIVMETVVYDELTLAELQAGDDALNSFTIDPAFVDAVNHDYHLAAGSPCLNTGVNVGLTTDYDGQTVADPPEIGAYEKV